MATRFAHRDVILAGSSMHHLDAGDGQPVVFLHGNPTSSYLWRSVLADIELGPRRAVTVDLIGMGRSDRPPIGYHLTDHIAYLEAFAATLDLHDIVFVAHDWGVAIALEYLHRQPARVAAIAFKEVTCDRWRTGPGSTPVAGDCSDRYARPASERGWFNRRGSSPTWPCRR